jgi:hypothetical protein
LEENDVDMQIILKRVSKKLVGKAQNGLSWLMIWTSGALPWLR